MNARLAIAGGGEELRVVAAAETVAIIDTTSLRLREPSPPAPAPVPAGQPDGSAPWILVAGLGALLLGGAGALAAVLRRRRRLVAT